MDRYDHFMQKEIHEQPDSILNTMRGRVAFGRKSFEDKASKLSIHVPVSWTAVQPSTPGT